MSCQDSLVRQQPCTSTYLFSLLAIGHGRRRWRPAGAFVTMLSALMLHAFFLGSLLPHSAGAQTLATPSRSTTIALTSDETRLVVVNREANTVSIIEVKDAQGIDVANKLDEIAVGLEPRCVAVHPNDAVAYVTNGLSASVSVVDLVLGRVATEVPVGTEPRGCALTPNGNLLYVANHTQGTVSIIVTSNPLNPILDGTVQVGRNPTAIAITNDGDGDDADETVFVTQIFAELNPDFVDPTFNGNGEARDLGKQGVVQAFPGGQCQSADHQNRPQAARRFGLYRQPREPF